ncbi:MAG: arylsulfatase [Nitrosopumilus sp.]|nr:arylsulfatase [Nitrosopumilus sp.]
MIPLILSIGIAPVLPFDFIQEANALKSEGTPTPQYGSGSGVCGDKLCSEMSVNSQTITKSASQTVTDNPNTAFAATGNDQPNIIVIMPDDIGWYNIGAYNDGIMAGITPNIDKIGQDGMRFTDYYADPSCTAGRASFITGELPIRTGLTTVGQAGAAVGMPDEAPTIAAVLKSMGYSTGQFGKNHLGDLNQFLPTVHGFDEFFGYLYHLDALEDPFTRTYPQEQNLIIGPRNMIHSWASDVDDNTVEPRWGKIGKQVIEDAGTLPPKRMENLDSEILDHTINFMEKSIDEDKPFFVWLNPSRMHVITHLNEHYDSTRTPENGWSVYEAGMLEVDDTVGKVMNYLEEKGIKDNTIVVFTTDNGAEVFTWPDGGMTPFRGAKGQIFEGGMRVPMLVQWPAQIPSGIVENQMMSGLDWLPTLVAAAGNPNIVEELKDGKSINGKTYNVHLDGYNQLDMLTGQGPSNRDVVYYFAEANLGAVRVGDYKYRFIDQPNGWFGETVSIGWPVVTNLRLDPFERAGLPDGDQGSIAYYNYFVTEFWRFVEAQQQVGELAQSFIDYPPMQDPASFNLDSVKKKIQKMRSLGD